MIIKPETMGLIESRLDYHTVPGRKVESERRWHRREGGWLEDQRLEDARWGAEEAIGMS